MYIVHVHIFGFHGPGGDSALFRDLKVSKVHSKRARAGWSLGKGGSQGAEPRYRDPLNSKPPRPPCPGASQRSPWRPVQQRIGPIGSLTPHHLLFCQIWKKPPAVVSRCGGQSHVTSQPSVLMVSERRECVTACGVARCRAEDV
jgi:hypothetical protein